MHQLLSLPMADQAVLWRFCLHVWKLCDLDEEGQASTQPSTQSGSGFRASKIQGFLSLVLEGIVEPQTDAVLFSSLSGQCFLFEEQVAAADRRTFGQLCVVLDL